MVVPGFLVVTSIYFASRDEIWLQTTGPVKSDQFINRLEGVRSTRLRYYQKLTMSKGRPKNKRSIKET